MNAHGSERQTDASLLAGELRVAVGQLVRRLREQVEGDDLTKSQTSTLLRLERGGPATTTALAHAEGVRQQSMTKTVRILEEAGLISRFPDPEDGRKMLLDLTEAAREHFRTGRRAREDWLTDAIDATFSTEEIRQLSASAELLKRLAQSP